MPTIIAGHFETQEQLAAAHLSLEQAGFNAESIAAFYINPHGQHAIYPIGGDEKSSPGARHSGVGAATGGGIGAAIGAVAGFAATPLIGPLGIVIGAGLGAYSGSLIGAVGSTDDDSAVDEQAAPAPAHATSTHRSSGLLLAVRVDPDSQQHAIDQLRASGAQDIEQAQGDLSQGHWHDFDPRAVSQRI